MVKTIKTDTTPVNFLVIIPLIALIFALIHLAIEHYTGGVISHNLLNRSDLPAVSNWFGLITLPILGVALGFRLKNLQPASGFLNIPTTIIAGLLGSLLYGVLLAVSFEFDASRVASIAFAGLFVCALLLPVYRAEYLLGFVVGMTFTFGGVLPFFVATVVATFSFVVRYVFGALVVLVRGVKKKE